jgi:PAS domain-containing protein
MSRIAAGAASGTQVEHPSSNPADLSVLSGVAPELAAAFASLAGEIALVIDEAGVIRNVALGGAAPGHPASDWIGKPWIETVTDSTRRKIEMLLSDVRVPGVTRRREVNHPTSAGGDDIPVSYAALRLGPAGPVIALGRDLRAVAAIQQRIVDARQEMERDYWKMRQEQTRQRLLTQVASDAVMVVDAVSLEIIHSNPGAAGLFGANGCGLADPIRDVLSTAARTGRAAEVRTRPAPGAGLIDLSATPLRLDVDGVERLGLLVRARGAVEEGVSPDGAAIVIADTSGRVRVANDAFRQLCHAGSTSIDGRLLVEMLGDPQRHLAALLVEARRVGLVQRPAVLLGGGAAPTYEIHATATLIADGDQECIGLVLQRFESSQGDTLAAALATLVENVGATPLAELMQRASEAAERAAVETALRRAADDLRSAATLLGISDADLGQRLLRLGLKAVAP